MEENEYQEYLDHFNPELSPEIKQYATDDVFENSRYIFYRRQGKQQHGYCTHCKTHFETNGLRHNEKDECPNCKSICFAKSSGRGRKKMIDQAYFVYYEKSLIDPQAIVARGIYAVRDYTDDYHEVETNYLIRAWYIFENGNSVMLGQDGYYSSKNKMKSYGFRKCKSIYSLFSRFHNDGWFRLDTDTCYSRESIVAAVKNTPFQYSCWTDYHDDDMVKFFDLYSKYPCIEYLTKMGMDDLVREKLNGNNTYSAINWRGKTIFKVLKLSKKEINEIKAADISIDPLVLRLLQISKKDKSNLSFAEISKMEKYYGCYFTYLQKVLKYTKLRKADHYIIKQYEPQDKKDKHYYGRSQVIIEWKDYISDCITLEMDLKDESVLFPSNLYRAHQNLLTQVKVKVNEIFNKQIAARAKALQKYYFEDFGLLIRPAESSLELINEGKALHHCVGTYAERYAKGQTNLFVIRKAADPDKPYFTVEIQKNSIVQIRGNKNCPPDKEVAEFIKVFTEQKLNKKEVRIQVSA